MVAGIEDLRYVCVCGKRIGLPRVEGNRFHAAGSGTGGYDDNRVIAGGKTYPRRYLERLLRPRFRFYGVEARSAVASFKEKQPKAQFLTCKIVSEMRL